MDNLERIISVLEWADKVAEEMTDEEWKHLHDGEETADPLFG